MCDDEAETDSDGEAADCVWSGVEESDAESSRVLVSVSDDETDAD